jgi:hypothetical protein
MGENGEVSGHIFVSLRCEYANAVQNVGQTNLLPLNENYKVPVVFIVHMRCIARSHTNRRSDTVCLDARLIISLSVSKGQHSNPLHYTVATELHIQQPLWCKKKKNLQATMHPAVRAAHITVYLLSIPNYFFKCTLGLLHWKKSPQLDHEHNGCSSVHSWCIYGYNDVIHILCIYREIYRTTQLTTLVGRLFGIRNQSGHTKINDELTA